MKPFWLVVALIQLALMVLCVIAALNAFIDVSFKPSVMGMVWLIVDILFAWAFACLGMWSMYNLVPHEKDEKEAAKK